MRNVVRSLIAITLVACNRDVPTGNGNTMTTGNGPALTVVVGTRVAADSNGAAVLQVVASFRNETAIHLVLVQCPLFVLLIPDPSGVHPGRLDSSMACPAGSPMLDMAPGDSTTQMRTLTAEMLAPYAAGQYALNTAITTKTALYGPPVIEISLPLAAAP